MVVKLQVLQAYPCIPHHLLRAKHLRNGRELPEESRDVCDTRLLRLKPTKTPECQETAACRQEPCECTAPKGAAEVLRKCKQL